MPAIEVLGAVVSAVQLADISVRIVIGLSNVYAKIQDAPESIAKRKVQIEQLVDIARLIQRSPSLQTALVASILQDMLTEATALHELLKLNTGLSDGTFKKHWKAIEGIAREKRILASL